MSTNAPPEAMGAPPDVTVAHGPSEARGAAGDRGADRAEEVLRRSEERFRQLVESSMFGLAIGDETGRITYVNGFLLDLLGLSRDEMLDGALRWDALTPAEYLPLDAKALADLKARGATAPYEKAYLAKDGRLVPVLVGVVPLGRSEGGELEMAAYVLDLTPRERSEQALRESEERFRTLADNAPDVITRFDRDIRHVYANRAAERVSGIPRERFLGKTNAELGMPADLVAWWEEHIRRVFETERPETMEFELGGAKGTTFFEARLVPERSADGSVVSVLGLTRDVTDHRRARRQLEDLLTRERSDAENQRRMEEALREADQRKDEFLAMLAHELRNPLGAIANAARVIRGRMAQGRAADRPLEILERQIGNCARLLDDLLDVSRITRGLLQLRKQTVALDAVLLSAVESQRASIDAAGHRLTLGMPQPPVLLEADPTRLEQVVANLLDNAAKYTPQGGEIELAAERSGGELVIRVRDSGIGIPPDLLPRVFDLFVQEHQSLARTQGGLGLGLTLVRKLVEMHGGSVEARSSGPGRGSEFLVRLPARAEDRARAATDGPVTATVAAAPRRILLVEDNSDAAEVLAEYLESLGHEVTVARDGPAALEAAARVPPDIALLDIGLPGMDGYEVGRRLRQDVGAGGPILVALTGYGQEEDRRRSRDSGFAHHLTKPFEAAALERLLAELGRAR